VLWCGSDDGLVHVTRDAGVSWDDVTPPALPEWARINSIEAHPFEAGGLYIAATRYQLDDHRPYLFVTRDWGKSWRRIDGGIPEREFTRVIRADPDRRGLLYAGTERGVFVSFDDGEHWRSLQRNLPVVPITDLAVKAQDLIAATQGRGYWILDDLTYLHRMRPLAEQPVLFEPRPTARVRAARASERSGIGENPPAGVVFRYWLPTELAADAELSLTIADGDGTEIRTFTRKSKEPAPAPDGGADLRLLDAAQGANAFEWDLRWPAPKSVRGMVLWNDIEAGPRAIPGTYRATLRVAGAEHTVPFEIRPDPRSSASPEDLREQLRFVRDVGDLLTRVHRQIERIRDVRKQLDALSAHLPDGLATDAPLREALAALGRQLVEVEQALYQTSNQSRQDPLNFPIRLNDKLAGLLQVASSGDFAPTVQLRAVREQLAGSVEVELERLQTLLDDDLLEVNRLAREAGVAPVK
jgi:hypothetical protein